MRKTKFSRALAVLLAASMVFGAAPVNLQAEEILDEFVDVSADVQETAAEPEMAEVLQEVAVVEETPAEEANVEEPQEGIVDDTTDGTTDEALDETLDETLDESVYVVDEVTEEADGTIEAGAGLTGELNLDDSEILLEGIEEMEEEIPVETKEYAAGGSYTYITVEVYDSEGINPFLLEPTRIDFTYQEGHDSMLRKAGITDFEFTYYEDEVDAITRIQNIKNSADLLWSIAKNGREQAYWTNIAYNNKQAGNVYRYFYGDANINSEAKTQKDILIKYIADLTVEEKEKVKDGDAYKNALAIIVNKDATADAVSAAQTALDSALNDIPAEAIKLDTESLTLGVKKSASVQAVLEPATTTDTITWSIENENIAKVAEVSEDGTTCTVKAQLTPGTTMLKASTKGGVYAEIPVTVTAGTYVTISVEAYEGDDINTCTGRYILEPTRISTTSGDYVNAFLYAAVGVENVRVYYDNYNQVTGIADPLQPDGFLDNGDVSKGSWGFVIDGFQAQNGGIGLNPNPRAVAGQTIRIVYSNRGSSWFSTNVWNTPNKDELLEAMAGMNPKQKATDEYKRAQETALNANASSAEIAAALASLNALPENPASISQREAKLRIGETVMLKADDYVTWSIDDETVAAEAGKYEGYVNNYCIVKGIKAGTTTVKATDLYGRVITCEVKVVPPVYFQYSNSEETKQMEDDGSFTLTSLDEGYFVLNEPKEGETAVFECEDKLNVWNPYSNEWNFTYHWWVDDETGKWQPAAAKLNKQVTVSTGIFTTKFSINYIQVEGVHDLEAYIGGKKVSMDDPFEITGTMWTEGNYYYGEEVTVKGKDINENTITIPQQALNYETDDTKYNFRFVGNKLIINRAGEHTMTISLKQQSGKTDSAPSVSFKAICKEVPATSMHVDVDDANGNVCYIDEWQDIGQHYVGIRPGSWEASTGEKLNDGYHITFEPYNTTQRDVKWEVVEGADVATHSDLHSDGIIPYKAGTVKFKVTNIYNPEIYEYVTVTFKYKNPLQQATASKEVYTVAEGKKTSLTIDFAPENATEQRFNWTYSQDGIVKVTDKILSDESGMESWTIHQIEGIKEGIVTVTGTPWDQTAGCKPVTFTVVVGKTQTDAAAIGNVYKKIAAIGTVSLNSEAAIKSAREAYNALTAEQKALLGNALKTLESAEATLEAVKIANHKHSFGEYQTVKAPTVFEAGIKEHTCTECGAKETAPIETLSPTISINATKLLLKTKQSTSKFTVTGLASGDSVKSWKSSNTKIFKVSGKANGTCKITAGSKTGKATLTITLASGLQKKVTVTVQSGTVKTTKITGLKSTLTLAKGKKTTLKPVLTPFTSQQKITYSSSNKKVATVSSKGVVTAKAAGTAKITVKSGSKKVTVKVTVPKTKTTKITGVKESITVKKGKTYTLKPVLTPKASDEKITYKSSNTKVATVTSSGKIKGIKKGTATITVKSGSVSVKCVVTVK